MDDQMPGKVKCISRESSYKPTTVDVLFGQHQMIAASSQSVQLVIKLYPTGWIVLTLHSYIFYHLKSCYLFSNCLAVISTCHLEKKIKKT